MNHRTGKLTARDFDCSHPEEHADRFNDSDPARFRGTEADHDTPLVLDHTPFADCPTTRRFPRSAHGVDAAWPNDPSYANPIDGFDTASFYDDGDDQRRSVLGTLAYAIALVVAMAGIGVLLAWRG